LSYYVEALWYGSLGYTDVFWTTLNVQAAIFITFAAATFLVLYAAFVALKPARLSELAGLPILINGQPIKLPVEPVINLAAIGGPALIALTTGAAMMSDWPSFALYWYGRADAAAAGGAAVVDPIFGRPISFYLFTLPVWQTVSGWLMTLAVVAAAVAVVFVAITGGSPPPAGERAINGPAGRGVSSSVRVWLALLCVRACGAPV